MLTPEAIKTLGKALVAACELHKSEDCLRILKELERGVKPTEALLKASEELGCETKIDVTVNKVARKEGTDEQIAKEAKRLVEQWKSLLGLAPQSNGKTVKKEERGPGLTPSPDTDAATQATTSKSKKMPSPSGEPAKRRPSVTTSVIRHRKRSPTETPPNGTTNGASPPVSKKVKTGDATAEKGQETKPAASGNDKESTTRSHKRDKVDLAARMAVSATTAPKKVYKTRLGSCESLYDALAVGSEASPDELAILAAAVECAAWNKAEHDKGRDNALAAYTPHVRSLYQHLRSAKTPNLRLDLISGQLSAQQLVDMSPADFRTAEQKAEDEAVRQQAMKEVCFSAMSIAEDMRQSVMWRGGGR
ncbi:hypothetical protein JCM10908_003881 [Rhodotorula pacifica]|uniref:uncharacterized protein n=1 Tax=Rhodotorula pacifica TaxID=1495444 RepID=UPI003173A03A